MNNTVLNEPIYDSDAVNKKYVDKLMKNVKENSVYSDKEQQIGTWIDGKPIYRKTVLVTVPDSSKQLTIQSDEYSNIDLIVSARICRISKSSTISSACVNIDAVKMMANPKQITVYPTVTDFTNCTHLILEYTKIKEE
jgi:hypothetical protein